LLGISVNKQNMGQKVRIIAMLLGLIPFLHGHTPCRPGNLPTASNDLRPMPGGGLPSAPPKIKIEWISVADAQARQLKKQKPILIDLYTDWCGWCKVMDKKTYARPEVARYITEHFYPVKIDAESREPITWQGRKFTYNPNARMHDLAIFLTRGQLSFPQTIFIMTASGEPQAIPGYLEVKDMELLLKYFGEGHYGKQAFSDFQQNFSPSWK
jgi:thioredoxin-related protein